MAKGCHKIGIALELLVAAVILSFPFAIRLDSPWIGPGYALTVIVLLVGAGICERTHAPTPSPTGREADGMPYGSRGCKISKIGIVLRLLAAALILASPWMGLRGNPWIGFGYCLTVILLFVVARYYSKRANFSAD